jgi:ADP-ribose pyrophosphatase YjhB (NUDIX family)
MFEQEPVNHHIQKYIIGVLIHNKSARFKDLRPPKTDTNLFSYHLKILQKSGLVIKTTEGYSLSAIGLSYVDRVSIKKLNIRVQPKIITMILIQNSGGDVLVHKRTKQPYIDTWTLPYGKVHVSDASVLSSAAREVSDKLGIQANSTVRHVGDAYIRVFNCDSAISSTIAHICRMETDKLYEAEDLKWVRPLKLSHLKLAPAVENIVTRSFFGDSFYFAEFNIEWDS